MSGITYNAAIAEIQKILAEIESQNADIETLGAKIKRASELIAVCKDKLTKTNTEIEELLKKIE
ncbi:MAG: exodeoxyribonuclease VII small subunit [Prevotellaceae bacterium]|jgi:exodeoxyribonuclease VII small subunit|nr:exodeoxyribonuclease VII small subunit [Prevotellaceae bacterium]GHT31565.1 hypothetical protein FACS189434_01560 [Bacteroidia bacterium]